MTMEAVVAYFGIVLAGCAAVSIADSFAAAEIASRLRISNAAAIVTQVLSTCPLSHCEHQGIACGAEMRAIAAHNVTSTDAVQRVRALQCC